MTIQPILRMGHPVLKAIAEPVADRRDPAIGVLLTDMLETMRAAHGRGIAAPQIGVSKRVVMFHAPLTDETSRAIADAPLTVLINPVIAILDPTTADDVEGCLSVPGLAGQVPRPLAIRYRAVDPDGAVIDRVARDFHARVVLHECDHLDGVLYPQRMTDLSSLRFVSEPVED